MTIGDLRAALSRFRLLALALFVMIVSIGVGSLVVQPNRYESDAAVAIATKDGSLSFDAQQAVEFAIPPIVRRLTSAAFEQGVRARLQPAFRRAPLAIRASNDPGTTVINITAQSSRPAAALNAAQVAVAQIMQQTQSQTTVITPVSPAAAATSVKASRAPAILGGTFLLGVIAAVLAAAILHHLRPPIPRAERFRERYGHEVLGEIPRGDTSAAPSTAETFNGDGSPGLVEGVRSIAERVAMRVAARGELNTSIVITSWGDQDGKTTVATSLAWALAIGGRRTTIVDCDLRRPNVHELLGVQRNPGVADITASREVLSLCQETGLRTLDVIPAGTPVRHPSEILHEALPRFLAALQNRTVIIDTPPMFTPDTTAVIGEADFVVLVADHAKRTPGEIEQAVAELELSGTPILGVVLNRVTDPDTAGQRSFAYRADDEQQGEPTTTTRPESTRAPRA